MPRIIGRPDPGDQTIPWMGTVELLKDVRITETSKGARFWNAFGAYEKATKKGGQNKAVAMSAGYPISKYLPMWSKGTLLFVVGKIVDDEFNTKRTGKPQFKLDVKFCIEQIDYNAAIAQQTMQGYEESTVSDGNDYFPPPTF